MIDFRTNSYFNISGQDGIIRILWLSIYGKCINVTNINVFNPTTVNWFCCTKMGC